MNPCASCQSHSDATAPVLDRAGGVPMIGLPIPLRPVSSLSIPAMKTTFVTEWKMQQAWLPQPDYDWQPATVRVGWNCEAMLIEAELTDHDIFNPVTEFNQAAFKDGDVFEMFLRPEGQTAYFEFHVTPSNQLLQLRFANDREVYQLPAGDTLDERLDANKLWKARITSSVRVDAATRRWIVNATIPFSLVVESEPMQPGARWLCSFCRYDYTRGRRAPVLSSTSPHARCDFHRQQEWQPVEFPGC